MLRYFRINDPYRLVGLLVLIAIIYAPMMLHYPGLTFPELKGMVIGEKLNEDNSMYTQLCDNTAPLGAWFDESMESIFGRSLTGRHILAFVLIFLQGAFLGILFISRKVFNENTYIPSLIFCLLCFCSFDVVALSPELIGSVFLLLAINNMLKEIEFRVQRDETVFNLGLFISIASLFSFGFFIYLFCVIVILVFFTRSTPGKFLLLAFGFLLPHFLVISIAYLSGSLQKLWQYYYLANLHFDRQVFISWNSLLVVGIFPLLYFVVSIIMLQREARFSKYQSQVLQVMFLWIGFSVVYLFLCKDLRPQNLLVFFPSLTFLFSHFFLFIRRRKFAEMNIWILMLGIISVSYLSQMGYLKSVDYDTLLVPKRSIVKNKRMLVLENDPSYYAENNLATPYFNWLLAENIFRNPDFYEHVTEVYRSLKQDPAEMILDRENLMKPFFERIPEFKNEYVRKGDWYVRKASN